MSFRVFRFRVYCTPASGPASTVLWRNLSPTLPAAAQSLENNAQGCGTNIRFSDRAHRAGPFAGLFAAPFAGFNHSTRIRATRRPSGAVSHKQPGPVGSVRPPINVKLVCGVFTRYE